MLSLSNKNSFRSEDQCLERCRVGVWLSSSGKITAVVAAGDAPSPKDLLKGSGWNGAGSSRRPSEMTSLMEQIAFNYYKRKMASCTQWGRDGFQTLYGFIPPLFVFECAVLGTRLLVSIVQWTLALKCRTYCMRLVDRHRLWFSRTALTSLWKRWRTSFGTRSLQQRPGEQCKLWATGRGSLSSSSDFMTSCMT